MHAVLAGDESGKAVSELGEVSCNGGYPATVPHIEAPLGRFTPGEELPPLQPLVASLPTVPQGEEESDRSSASPGRFTPGAESDKSSEVMHLFRGLLSPELWREKHFRRPSFPWMHQVLVDMISKTGFGGDHYVPEDLDYQNLKDDRDAKVKFLLKTTNIMRQGVGGADIDLSPDDVLKGREVEKTLEWLELLHKQSRQHKIKQDRQRAQVEVAAAKQAAQAATQAAVSTKAAAAQAEEAAVAARIAAEVAAREAEEVVDGVREEVSEATTAAEKATVLATQQVEAATTRKHKALEIARKAEAEAAAAQQALQVVASKLAEAETVAKVAEETAAGVKAEAEAAAQATERALAVAKTEVETAAKAAEKSAELAKQRVDAAMTKTTEKAEMAHRAEAKAIAANTASKAAAAKQAEAEAKYAKAAKEAAAAAKAEAEIYTKAAEDAAAAAMANLGALVAKAADVPNNHKSTELTVALKLDSLLEDAHSDNLSDRQMDTLRSTSDVGYDPALTLPSAAWLEQWDQVEELLANGRDPDERADSGITALMWTAEKGEESLVWRLLACKAEVDLANSYGVRALHNACSAGHWGVVRLLLKHKADPTLSDKRGFTPYDRAKKKNIKQLLANAAQLGATPIIPPPEAFAVGRALAAGRVAAATLANEVDRPVEDVATIAGMAASKVTADAGQKAGADFNELAKQAGKVAGRAAVNALSKAGKPAEEITKSASVAAFKATAQVAEQFGKSPAEVSNLATKASRRAASDAARVVALGIANDAAKECVNSIVKG